MNEEQLAGWGRWVITTCLQFGTTFETACGVAALFMKGIRTEIRITPTTKGTP